MKHSCDLLVGDVVQFLGSDPTILIGKQGNVFKIHNDFACLRFILHSAIRFEGWFPLDKLMRINR
jgi:hypothetical protein